MRVRTRSPTFSLYREEGIPNKLGRSRENLAGGRRAWSLAPSWCACAPISIRPAALRARLHELGSLRMNRVGISERTFRCVGDTAVGWGGFVWVMRRFGGMGSAVIPKQNTLAPIPPMPKSWKGKRREQSEIRPNEAGWEPSRLQGAPSVTASP